MESDRYFVYFMGRFFFLCRSSGKRNAAINYCIMPGSPCLLRGMMYIILQFVIQATKDNKCKSKDGFQEIAEKVKHVGARVVGGYPPIFTEHYLPYSA